MKNIVHLFPLTKISLQPGTQRPLNIFEPRYLQMIEDSLKSEIPVALVYGKTSYEEGDLELPHEIYSHIRPITGIGLPRMIQRSEDGTMLIMLPGEFKGRITKILKTDTPYIVAEFEKIDEHLKVECENVLLLRRISNNLKNWVEENVKLPGQKEALLGKYDEPSRVVGLYCEFVVETPEDKQKILEIDDVNEKIQFLALNS
jgi:Lon protease-like protein